MPVHSLGPWIGDLSSVLKGAGDLSSVLEGPPGNTWDVYTNTHSIVYTRLGLYYCHWIILHQLALSFGLLPWGVIPYVRPFAARGRGTTVCDVSPVINE